ncbi:uncharacterized protein LOC143556745 [Bidens hawaiensis]|uniref:uncharacterized protein LOC143556745 n=1 Tax=Bidens hawaiensis TaxID=980011 RepID=UPI004049279E
MGRSFQQQNSLGSMLLYLLLHHHHSTSLWSTCRRKFIHTIGCGCHMTVESECRSDVIITNNNNNNNNNNGVKKKKSEKLSELLRMSELLEEQEELEQVVRRLQYDDVLGGAKDVRRLTKENADVRTTLELLGAIPPLVGMLDSGDLDFQITGLYALLNIGIGNDT